MRIFVRQDLPIERWDARSGDTRLPGLDVTVPLARTERTSAIAIIVLRSGVARTPLLHDELLPRVLRLSDIWLQSRGGKVARPVGVDGEDIQGGAGEVWAEEGVGEVSSAASGDEDAGVACEI